MINLEEITYTFEELNELKLNGEVNVEIINRVEFVSTK